MSKYRENKRDFRHTYYVGNRISRIASELEKKELKSKETVSEDTINRIRIQKTIIKLRDSGDYTMKEALKILQTEFPDSKYIGFFEKWIEHAYKPETQAIERKREKISSIEAGTYLSKTDNPSQDLGEGR